MGLKHVTKSVDPAHYQRASKVPTEMVGPYMEDIILEMHRGLDDWRYGRDVTAAGFRLALDACNALFVSAEARGLTTQV